MKIRQYKILNPNEIEAIFPNIGSYPDLIIAFGFSDLLESLSDFLLRKQIPSIVCGCTTSGEILDNSIYDNALILTLINFESTKVLSHSILKSEPERIDDTELGHSLLKKFDTNNLKHIFVLSDGLNINGSKLVEGLRSNVPAGVTITGGMAADGSRFDKTKVLCNEGLHSNKVTGIGFYGTSLKVGYGSLGGWDSFGPERVVTKSKSNVLYELDEKPALSLYKEYLGELSKDLPSSGLLFPLTIKVEGSNEPLVRTVLSVNEKEKSLTFAGDIPEGCCCRLMKANVNRLLDGAADAANISSLRFKDKTAELAILISCVGRRLVLKQRAEDEIDAVREHLGPNIILTGFYSYGEIAPFMENARCELHNQTMTITAFSER